MQVIRSSLLKRNAALNNTATMGNFLNNHDDDTLQELLVKKSGLSAEEAYNLMKVAATLQITAKGQPVNYYVDEIGQAGANDWPYQTNRRDFDWTELEAQKTNSNSIYNHYKTMLSIRNAYTDVFARGSRTSILSSDEDGYDVIARSYGDTTLYVGMNINKKATEVTIPVSAEAGSKMENLYDGNEYTVSADKTVTVSIPAAKDGGTVILTEVKKTVDPTPADPGKKDPTPTPAKKDGVISVTDKAAIETKKAAPKSGDDNEAATYVCLLGLAMVAITAATYRKKKACK